MASLLMYGARVSNPRSSGDYGLEVHLPERAPGKTNLDGAPPRKKAKLVIAVESGFDLCITSSLSPPSSVADVAAAAADDEVVVVVVRADAAEALLAALDGEAWIVVEAPRAPTKILTNGSNGVYCLTTGPASSAPSCAELPRPELCTGLAADVLTACLAHPFHPLPVTVVTCLTTAPAAHVDIQVLRDMLSAVLSAAGGLVAGDPSSDVPGLLSQGDVASAPVTAKLQAIMRRKAASPLHATAVRMFA